MSDVIVVSNPQNVVQFDDGTTVSVDNTTTQVVAVGMQGPVGPPGASGSNFLFIQTSPSATWTINHNLSKYPSVTVIDSTGALVEGNTQYITLNQVVLTFSGAFSGEATCN